MILWSEALCISAIPQASNCQNRTVWQSGACQAPCRHLLSNRKNRFPEQSVHTTDFSRQGIALITFSQMLVDSVGFQAHLPASPRRDWILNGKKKKSMLFWMPALQVQSDARPCSVALQMCEGTQQETTLSYPCWRAKTQEIPLTTERLLDTTFPYHLYRKWKPMSHRKKLRVCWKWWRNTPPPSHPALSAS